jgi:hypothetical protein
MIYEGKCPFFKVIDEFISRYIPDDEKTIKSDQD